MIIGSLFWQVAGRGARGGFAERPLFPNPPC